MTKCAYLFLDEAGNFDFSPNGTRYFVMTCVSAQRPFLFSNILDEFKHDFLEHGLDTQYFHCAEDNSKVRRQVFDTIKNHLPAIKIDSLIVEKPKVGPALQVDERFYPQMLSYLLRYALPQELKNGAEEIIVITDSIPLQKKRKAIEKAIHQTLSSTLPASMKYRILHHPSCSHYGLQVADYCCWAIFRKWQKEETFWYNQINPGIRSEFEIFRNGTRHYY